MVSPEFMFLQYRISMSYLLAFQLLFLSPRYTKRKSFCIAACCFLLTGILDYLFFFTRKGVENQHLMTAVQFLIVQAAAFILCCYRDFRTLFVGISSSTYVLPGNIISTGLFIYKGSIGIALLVQIMIHAALLAGIAFLMHGNQIDEMEEYTRLWRTLCLIQVLFYAVIYVTIFWPSDIYLVKSNWIAVILILILMEMTNVLMIKLISQQHVEAELVRNNQFLETYAEGLRREAAIMRREEERMKIFRHDSRHVCQTMYTYLENGEIEQVLKILKEMNVKLQAAPLKKYCENIVINGIVAGCMQRAEKENIKFISKIDMPKEMGMINEFELATVISNLLNNALYAAAKVEDLEERKVKIQMFPVKGQLILGITNTFAGTCRFSKETGLPISDKGKNHGYGLRSVKAYAEKNHAIFQYSIESGCFCVRLLIDM